MSGKVRIGRSAVRWPQMGGHSGDERRVRCDARTERQRQSPGSRHFAESVRSEACVRAYLEVCTRQSRNVKNVRISSEPRPENHVFRVR